MTTDDTLDEAPKAPAGLTIPVESATERAESGYESSNSNPDLSDGGPTLTQSGQSITEDPSEQATVTASSATSKLPRLMAYLVLPAVVMSFAGAAAYLRYQDLASTEIDQIRTQSVETAKRDTVAMLSYTPATAEAKLNAAGDLLTGSFRDSYLALVRNTVIPGAKQKQITAHASVPAGSSVSATTDHARVMVFVNQTTTVGNDVPTESASVVAVNLDKVDGRWLVSGFEPL